MSAHTDMRPAPRLTRAGISAALRLSEPHAEVRNVYDGDSHQWERTTRAVGDLGPLGVVVEVTEWICAETGGVCATYTRIETAGGVLVFDDFEQHADAEESRWAAMKEVG